MHPFLMDTTNETSGFTDDSRWENDSHRCSLVYHLRFCHRCVFLIDHRCSWEIDRWEINQESLMFINANYMIHNISDSWLISHRSIVDLRSSTNTDDSWEIHIDDKIEGDTPVNIGEHRWFMVLPPNVSLVNTDVSLVDSIKKACIFPSIYRWTMGGVHCNHW